MGVGVGFEGSAIQVGSSALDERAAIFVIVGFEGSVAWVRGPCYSLLAHAALCCAALVLAERLSLCGAACLMSHAGAIHFFAAAPLPFAPSVLWARCRAARLALLPLPQPHPPCPSQHAYFPSYSWPRPVVQVMKERLQVALAKREGAAPAEL